MPTIDNPAHEIHHRLDARGLLCPMPVLKARRIIQQMQDHQILQILCTDPGAPQDFESLAQVGDHRILGVNPCQADDQWAAQSTEILLQKGPTQC